MSETDRREPVCVQLPTSAVNVTLPELLLSAGRVVVDRYLLAAVRTAANPPQRRAAAE